MVMYDPPHPGEVIKELCLQPLGLTVTDAARGLGISRKTLSALLNGRFITATTTAGEEVWARLQALTKQLSPAGLIMSHHVV